SLDHPSRVTLSCAIRGSMGGRNIEEACMAIQITHVRFTGTDRTHESIVRYKWQVLGAGTTGDSDRPTMVEWVTGNPGQAFVGSDAGRALVGVVRPSGGSPYLRTYADAQWTNN